MVKGIEKMSDSEKDEQEKWLKFAEEVIEKAKEGGAKGIFLVIHSGKGYISTGWCTQHQMANAMDALADRLGVKVFAVPKNIFEEAQKIIAGKGKLPSGGPLGET